jgi:threonine/homoserine/homoserine lactone efflux protein
METAMSIEFLITSLIVVASPGTGVVYTVAAGLTRGARGSVIAAFGCTIGIIPHMVAALTGIAALLHTSALAFQLLKYLGVAYLLYLAWQSLKADGTLKVESDMAPRSAWRVIGSAVLVNLLNPKLSLFFLAFLPQFIAPQEASPLARMLEMSAVFMAMTFAVFALYGACAARARDHIISRPAVLAWMRRGFAAGFVALAAKLAVTRQ